MSEQQKLSEARVDAFIASDLIGHRVVVEMPFGSTTGPGGSGRPNWYGYDQAYPFQGMEAIVRAVFLHSESYDTYSHQDPAFLLQIVDGGQIVYCDCQLVRVIG